jgi:hypothetical protein
LKIYKFAGGKTLSKEIHLIAVETDLKSDFRFKEQIKSSSGSVMDNSRRFERDEILNLDNFYQLQRVLLVKQDRITL